MHCPANVYFRYLPYLNISLKTSIAFSFLAGKAAIEALTWKQLPESVIQKAVEGVNAMELVKGKSLEELESWRDERLVALLRLLWV